VQHLIAISRLRREAQRAGLSDVIATGSKLRIAPAKIPDSRRVRLERMYPGAKHSAQNDVILVPFPVVNGELLADADLIDWVSRLITAIFPVPEAQPADAAVEASAVAAD
jgi:transcription-repair coupling factor (superfamily II helicase)